MNKTKESKLLRACKNAEYAIVTYLEEGRLVNAGDKDIMPIIWGIIEDMREAIAEYDDNAQ